MPTPQRFSARRYAASALALAAVLTVALLSAHPAHAYNRDVRACINTYDHPDLPRLAFNTLSAACLCDHDSRGLTRCASWPAARIRCTFDNMPKAADNNDARQVNTYCKRKSGLRHN
jgi:hypothetical protein